MLPCSYLYWQNRIIIIQRLVLHNKNISKLQAYYPRFQGMTLMYGTQHVIMIKALLYMYLHDDSFGQLLYPETNLPFSSSLKLINPSIDLV